MSERESSMHKESEETRKSFRGPPRPVCMLEALPFTPPTDDYNDLSRFLRISTMPGYNNNEQISEYKDSHNMAVWKDKKGKEAQIFKFRRDWLSDWGEQNVKEQRWRKAWVQKFGADKTA